MKYGYLGPSGTFCEMALLKFCRSEDEKAPLSTIEEIGERVNRNKIERGVLPLENSLEGSVNKTHNLLLELDNIQIVDEIVIPIIHNLLAVPGTKINQIKKVLSHPQAIKQSSKFIRNHLSEREIIYTDSTARAAEIVSENENYAMIGSRYSGKGNGLEILVHNIQDYSDNYTRFIVITNTDRNFSYSDDEYEYKTSLICTPEVNRPGVLHDMLAEFAGRSINLSRIESRPTKKKLGEYIFYIDIDGHRQDEQVRQALREVKSKSGYFKILGSYKKYYFKEGRNE